MWHKDTQKREICEGSRHQVGRNHVTTCLHQCIYICTMNTIRLYKAINIMRQSTEAGRPFMISYLSYNSTKGISNGVRIHNRVILRQGYNKTQSHLYNELLSFKDIETKENRQCYVALLLSINNIKIRP